MFRKISVVLFLALSSALLAAQTDVTRISPQARRIHDSAIVIDTHADTPQRFVDEHFDIGTVTPVSEGNVDLQKARQGNLGAEFFSIWVDPQTSAGHYTQRALDLMYAVYQQAARHPDQMVMAFSAEDIVRARTGPHKRRASLMGLEGCHSIG